MALVVDTTRWLAGRSAPCALNSHAPGPVVFMCVCMVWGLNYYGSNFIAEITDLFRPLCSFHCESQELHKVNNICITVRHTQLLVNDMLLLPADVLMPAP